MNKRDADEYAGDLVAEFLSGLFNSRYRSEHPWVYGPLFGEAAEGRRLSPADLERVDEAILRIQDRIAELADRRAAMSHKTCRTLPKVDGKPGARWQRY